MAHVLGALGCLTHRSESFRQHLTQARAIGDSGSEFRRETLEISACVEAVFQFIDTGNNFAHTLEFTAVLAAEQAGEKVGHVS